jgi:hypothetical protein
MALASPTETNSTFDAYLGLGKVCNEKLAERETV